MAFDIKNIECEVIDTNIMSRNIKLFWRPKKEDIPHLISAGVVPIEMAEGETSYVDEMVLDHHNQYNHMPAACKTALEYVGIFGDTNNEKPYMFMVNHVDLDCVLSGALLLDLLDNIRYIDNGKMLNNFVELAALDDTDPLNPLISGVPESQEMKIIRTWKDCMKSQKNSGWAWIHGLLLLHSMCFRNVLDWTPTFNRMKQKELDRVMQGNKDYMNAVISEDNTVVYVAPSKVWAFDIHFQRNKEVEDFNQLDAWKHHVVMAWVPGLEKVTISCPNLAIAEKVFGNGGLCNIFSIMPKYNGECWGGRQTVGGSPRGVKITQEQGKEAFDVLCEYLKAQKDKK